MFLVRVQVLPWDSHAASVYGDLRAACALAGVTLGGLDMMIAAHAIATQSVLVTHNKAFTLLRNSGLLVEDWVERN